MVTRKLRTGKVVSTLMVLVLTFMFVVTPVKVSAQTTRAALCNDCNNGQMVIREQWYSKWSSPPAMNPCVHGHRQGDDWLYTRTKYIKYKCTYCGVQFTNTFEEIKRECHGFN